MKNKRIGHISKSMSKRHGIFTENFTIFSQMQVKLETCRNLNLINPRRSSFGGDRTLTPIRNNQCLGF